MEIKSTREIIEEYKYHMSLYEVRRNKGTRLNRNHFLNKKWLRVDELMMGDEQEQGR